jgi:hypothetical protein
MRIPLPVALAALAVTLATGGCESEDQKRRTAQCVWKGGVFIRLTKNGNTGPRASYVRLCMAADGYDLRLSETACAYTTEMASDPACYLPSGSIARLLRNIEVAWSR